jgi:hypothetical protein
MAVSLFASLIGFVRNMGAAADFAISQRTHAAHGKLAGAAVDSPAASREIVNELI